MAGPGAVDLWKREVELGCFPPTGCLGRIWATSLAMFDAAKFLRATSSHKIH